MTVKKTTVDITGRVIIRCTLLIVTYVGLIFILPANHAAMHEYHLRPFEYRSLLFAVSLPSLVAWAAAFIGYARLHQYARAIADTPEGPSFRRLATGCTWLAWSLPLPTIISLILNAIANKHPGFHSSAIIISNYINLILPVIALTIISSASRALTASAKQIFTATRARSIIILFIIAGSLYCYLTFQRFDLKTIGSTDNPYYLPIWLMLVSVIIPYLYAWFVGSLAAYEIAVFSKNVKGVLYRQALRLLVGGLIAVVASSIALQYIGSASPRTTHLVLNYKLALTSSFRILAGIGYILIALGANRLKKIEEV